MHNPEHFCTEILKSKESEYCITFYYIIHKQYKGFSDN